MNKIISTILGAAIILGVLCAPVLVKATDTQSAQELIQQLQQQIEQLKAQIEAIKAQIEELIQAKKEIKETAKEVKVTLKLLKQMWYGMSGEDVELLQEILATDPEIYPEGLKTGWFGPLTRNAVKRFQKVAGIEQVGVVGPKTLAKINELLEEGAGKSGKVPPGLLIAKLKVTICHVPPGNPDNAHTITVAEPAVEAHLAHGDYLGSCIEGEEEEEEEEEDTTPPIISSIIATVSTSSAEIIWLTDEEADSTVWYATSTPLVVPDSTPSESDSDLVLNHEIAIFDLISDTTYYYIVSSADAVGNSTSSAEDAFNTLAE